MPRKFLPYVAPWSAVSTTSVLPPLAWSIFLISSRSLPSWTSAFSAAHFTWVWSASVAQCFGATSAWAPHMWAALSMAPSVTNMPDQFSFSIIAIAASAAHVSPPRWFGSLPGQNRLPSEGYIHVGNAAAVP